MVALSKFKLSEFYRAQRCNELLHPDGCFETALRNLCRIIITNSKYFATAFLIQALLTIKKLDWEKLFDIFKYYAEAVHCGIWTGWSYSLTLCMLRHLLRNFSPYTISVFPVLVGGVGTICSATPRVRRLYFTSTIQCAIESVIIQRSNVFTKLLFSSLPVRTLLFMCCSALIMHAKSEQKLRAFWFLQSVAMERKGSSSPSSSSRSTRCEHKESSCDLYLANGLRNYLGIGFTLDLAKALISQVPADAAGVFGTPMAKLGKVRLNSTAFLASYVTIYRFAHCYLNRKTHCSLQWNHTWAAFFGGVSYMLWPLLTLQCYAIVVSMEIVWRKFLTYKAGKSRSWLRLLQSLPAAHLLYLLSLVYLVHNYTWSKSFVSKLAQGFINGTSGNYPQRISLRLKALP